MSGLLRSEFNLKKLEIRLAVRGSIFAICRAIRNQIVTMKSRSRLRY